MVVVFILSFGILYLLIAIGFASEYERKETPFKIHIASLFLCIATIVALCCVTTVEHDKVPATLKYVAGPAEIDTYSGNYVIFEDSSGTLWEIESSRIPLNLFTDGKLPKEVACMKATSKSESMKGLLFPRLHAGVFQFSKIKEAEKK